MFSRKWKRDPVDHSVERVKTKVTIMYAPAQGYLTQEKQTTTSIRHHELEVPPNLFPGYDFDCMWNKSRKCLESQGN